MCDRLGELRDALGAYAAGFDVSLLSAEDAGRAMGEAVAIERLAATVKVLAAARAADTGAWESAGERSAAHHLARVGGSSLGQACREIETARGWPSCWR